MAFECRVELDSISDGGVRLTTFVVTFPRFLLAEWNTHRVLSRNSASSRAIPVERRVSQVVWDPFVPLSFGKNQKGMQAGEPLDEESSCKAREVWDDACAAAINAARELAKLGVHKQHANRLLEPFAWHTVICSATDWKNFFAQRDHHDAQPEFQTIASMMKDAMAASTPQLREWGQWHLPMLDANERLAADVSQSSPALLLLKKVSAGRCARVSYETHDGRRDQSEDVALADRLIAARPMHASPLEHQATPENCRTVRGNFRRWRQFRHEIEGESVREGS